LTIENKEVQSMSIVLSEKNYVEQALSIYEDNAEMLSVIDFIDITNFPIDNLFIDKFWATLQEDKLIYVTDEIIQWMGFSGKESRHRKDHFLQLLSNNSISYISYNNKEYENFLTPVRTGVRNIYPEVPNVKNASKLNHILLTSDSLQRTINCINNSNGDGEKVRNHYLRLLELFDIYDRYKSEYTELRNKHSLTIENKEVQSMTVILSEKSYVERALSTYDDNAEMLSVIDFINITNFPIDNLFIDKFWATLQEDKLIYITDEIIQWMGFSAELVKNRKTCFMRLLNDNKIGYITYTNEEYENFLKLLASSFRKIYPEVPNGKNASKLNHILLTSDSLQRTINCINNSNRDGEKVRNHYLRLLELFDIYDRYKSEYTELRNKHSLTIENKEVQSMTVVLSEKSYVERALSTYDDNAEMLTVIDFIDITNFPINNLFIDKFWATLQEDKLIYVTDELIQWMGF